MIKEEVDGIKIKHRAKDICEMTEGQLLRELVDRFIRYDRARDRYVDFLQHRLINAGIDYENGRYEELHMEQDKRFCMCREIVRLVKNDPNAMWC